VGYVQGLDACVKCVIKHIVHVRCIAYVESRFVEQYRVCE